MHTIIENKLKNCYCGSYSGFENCCKPIVLGLKKAASAEQLMRSRYTAFCIQEVDYLVETTHISTRKFHRKSEILTWSQANTWLKLEIIFATTTIVEFKAFFVNEKGEAQIHHEQSTFILENGSWFYVDGMLH